MRRARLQQLGMHALVIGLCALTAFPLLWMLATAFAPSGGLRGGVLPTELTTGNFTRAFELAPVARWLFNSILIAAAITAGKMLVSIPAAYAFACLRFPGRQVLFALVVGTMIVPDVVTLIPNYIFMSDLGWLNTPQGVVVPMIAFTGFYVFMLRQAMLSIPREIIDAATTDGAGTVRVLLSVVLPLVRPAVAVMAIIAFIGAWNLYLWPQLMLTETSSKTLTIGLQAFAFGSDGTGEWGALMAMALLAVVPPLILFAIAQRSMISTLAGASTKG